MMKKPLLNTLSCDLRCGFHTARADFNQRCARLIGNRQPHLRSYQLIFTTLVILWPAQRKTKVFTTDQNVRSTTLVTIVLGLLFLVSACGGADEGGAVTPTSAPTATAPAVAPTSTPVSIALIDRELLGAPGLNATCDQPEGVQFTCTDLTGNPQFDVQVSASTYARSTWRFDPIATPLTGDETLYLAGQQTGTLSPNLYLVERNGRRIVAPLALYGWQAGDNQLHLPLREIRDKEGAWPNFAEVNGIELVFEWTDMAGTLALQSLQFQSVWRETVQLTAQSHDRAAALTLAEGFTATALADQLIEVTQLAFDGQQELWVSLRPGRIWRYRDTNADGVYDERLLYAAGFEEVVGLLPDPVDGAIWVGGRGALYRLVDTDGNGVADGREARLEGLPWGRHQNNGLTWNPDPDPFTGETGTHWLYFGLGSTDDLVVGGDLNATVLRFPRDGQGPADLETVSRGNRNAYAVLWAPVPVDLAQPAGPTAWQLFASENGPDFNEAPDEVNHIRWQHHYGFPDQFGPVADGATDGQPYSGPIYPVTAHASANGLAYVSNPAWPPADRTLYVSLFGEVFSPEVVGHTVERITLTPVETATGPTYRGEPTTFIAGLERPLPLTLAPDGNLVIGDYSTGVVYKVKYTGE